jgi:hypothetical protein
MAAMLAYPFSEALRASAVSWPPYWDGYRDIGLAHTMLAGHYPADACYPGEVNWYNPLMGVITALGGWLSGAPLSTVNIALGPWLNLLGPVLFAVLIARLTNAWVALAALVYLLFGKPIAQPVWASAAYSPWLLAPNTTQALYFLALLLLFLALQRNRWPWHAAAGIAWGVTFLGHTMPALAIGGIYLLLLAWSQAEAWRGGVERPAWRGFFLSAAVAFVVSLPYTGPILWKYQFHVVNEWPSIFADPYVELQHLPERLRESLRRWENLPALLGLAVALRHARKHVAMRVIVVWAAVAAAFLVHHYVWQWLRQQGVLVAGLVPGHHALVLAYGVKAACFGLGLGALAVWCARRVARSTLEEGLPLPDHARAVALVLAMSVAACAWFAPMLRTWPAYQQTRDSGSYADLVADQVATCDWILGHTAIGEVFLADWAEAVTLVQPAGRKLVATMLFYSNPYVDVHQRLTDTRLMHEALAAGDDAAFRALATPYQVRYVVVRGEWREKILAAAPHCLILRWQSETVAVFEVRPPTA